MRSFSTHPFPTQWTGTLGRGLALGIVSLICISAQAQNNAPLQGRPPQYNAGNNAAYQQQQQQTAQQRQYTPQQIDQMRRAAAAQAAAATRSNAPAAMANRGGVPVQGTTPQRPFPALNAQQQQYLQSILAQWESKSQETKTMTCNFQRFYYKPIQAKGSKNGVWSVATGEIRYAAPDNGYFFVKDMVFFSGVEAGGKPKYAANPNDVGEYWVCTGDTLKSFDRVKKVCKVLQVPPQLRGQNIFESPLPFVFNLDAQRMQQRYWIQPLPPPANNPNVIMVKAYPKRQADRGMYKWVQFAVDKRTFNPLELILADPNYDEKTAPNVQLYKFTDFKRNALLDKFAQWRNQFIQIMPPKDWQVVTNTVPAPAPQSAAAPGGAVPGGSAPGGTTQRR